MLSATKGKPAEFPPSSGLKPRDKENLREKSKKDCQVCVLQQKNLLLCQKRNDVYFSSLQYSGVEKGKTSKLHVAGCFTCCFLTISH